MNVAKTLTGRCLCGAVSFTATDVELEHHAWHCEMCRRWGGGPFFGMHCAGVSFDGEEHVSRYASSEWAQRGFCSICGSNLFYYMKPRDSYSLCAGTFDDQSRFVLTSEIFIDRKPPGYEFAGEHELMTEQEVFEKYAPKA